MRYTTKDFNEHFKKISNKKITNKIVKDTSSAKKIFCMGIAMLLFIAAAIVLQLENREEDAVALWNISLLLIIAIVIIAIKMDNKLFNEYSILNQEFYLLYLTRDYAIKHIEDTKYLDYMYAIQTNLTQTLNKNINIMRAIQIFEITNNEKLLIRITNDFRGKIKHSLCEKKQVEEIIKAVDILLNILLIRINLSNEVLEEINSEIESLIKEYISIIDGLEDVEPRYTWSSKIKLLSKRGKKLNTPIGWLVLTIIILVLYLVWAKKSNGTIEPGYVITIAISMIALAKAFDKGANNSEVNNEEDSI